MYILRTSTKVHKVKVKFLSTISGYQPRTNLNKLTCELARVRATFASTSSVGLGWGCFVCSPLCSGGYSDPRSPCQTRPCQTRPCPSSFWLTYYCCPSSCSSSCRNQSPHCPLKRTDRLLPSVNLPCASPLARSATPGTAPRSV